MRYVDDTVLIAENKEELQRLLDMFEEETERKGRVVQQVVMVCYNIK